MRPAKAERNRLIVRLLTPRGKAGKKKSLRDVAGIVGLHWTTVREIYVRETNRK